MTADLYHVTRARDADSIFLDGLVVDSDTPAQKQARELTADKRSEEVLHRESPTEQAERWFDEVVADAKRAVDGAGEFPAHQPANFFWPTENQARESAKSVNWAAVIVGVDRSEMPGRCRCAIGPIDGLDEIFKKYYDTARDHDTFDSEEQYERAKEWWREVEWYEGQSLRRHEIWCGCNVPPHAIEWVHDPRRGTRIYEPPGENQRRLLDFAQ